jgi:hypothetical protein
MRKHLGLVALPFVLFLIGCEASPYPLSVAGDSAIKAELLGDWRSVDEDGDELLLSVLGFNEFEYLAVVKTPDEEPPSFFRMYESDVDGVLFANVQCLNCDEDDQEYLFGRLTIDDGALHTQWLEDAFYETTEEAESPEDAHRALVEALSDNRVAFSEDWVWSRAEN